MEQLFSLRDRVALVTGGSRGIGRMIAAGFLRHGARRVYITSRKAADCEATAGELSALGDCIALPCDVSTNADTTRLAAELAAREPALHIVVHNAGAAWNEPIDSFSESGWDKVVDLNMKAPFFLTQALLPLLRNASREVCAKVIHIASIDGISVTSLETYPYGASKAGLIHLTKRMALRLVQDNIVVSCIAPGAFPTDMNRHARDHADEVSRQIPARRLGTEADITGAAVYLASSAGDYMVGSTLVVDGGWTLTRQ